MLPKIVSYARTAFQHRDPEAREDLVQEVVANACVAFKALWDRGKQAVAYPTVLASYGIRQVRDHRKVGGKLNIKDVLSRYCQKHKGVIVERLDKFDEKEGEWLEVLVEDRHAGPADTAAARLDLAAWFKSLSPKDRRIAKALATGGCTGDVAKKFGLSAGRISQKRRAFMEGWQTFQGGQPSPAAA
jgi:DNA-directed RNA polymerase specialized sigma24 family protein